MTTKLFISRCFIVINLLFLLKFTFSQENFKPGFIVFENGDTLQGYIDYRNWDINPNEISFKEKPEENIKLFTPHIIKEFCVLDEKYRSAFVQTEISTPMSSLLYFDEELRFADTVVFLQTMIEGGKCLYSYKNQYGKEYFYIKNNSAYELLIYRKYIRESEEDKDEIKDGLKIVAENKKYLGQLSSYLNDCPTIYQKITNTEYTKKSIYNLFNDYYDCTSKPVEFQKKREKISLKYGVLGGISISRLNFKNDDYSYLVNTNFSSSLNITAGLYFNVVFPRNQRKWSLENEIIYTSYKVNGTYSEYFHEERYTTINTTLGYTYLKLNNLIRYKYPIKNVFIYLNAGISNGYNIAETNKKISDIKLYTDERHEEELALEDRVKYEQGLIIGLGFMYKKFSFESRFERGNGMCINQGLRSVSTRYYFLFGYNF